MPGLEAYYDIIINTYIIKPVRQNITRCQELRITLVQYLALTTCDNLPYSIEVYCMIMGIVRMHNYTVQSVTMATQLMWLCRNKARKVIIAWLINSTQRQLHEIS